MRSWSIGEVARLLGVKPHVIRYWESELPLLSPRKGLSGRREYGSREIGLLLRFRHLLYERKFTIEGAKRAMWEALGGPEPDSAARFSEVRSGLIEALMTLRRDRAIAAAGGVGMSGGREGGMTEESTRERFEAMGQGHLFAHWPARPAHMKRRLLEDLASIDPAVLGELRASLQAGMPAIAEPLVPAPYVTREQSRADAEARELGEELVHRSRTALLTVAGGQGSRLGFEGPKGMFPVTPIRRLTLFAAFAEKLRAARRWYGADIQWLIMTSPHTHAATEDYFEREKWFGLGKGSVTLFVQGTLPSLSPEGALLLAQDGGIFSNPNGHGGAIDALRRAGLGESLRDRGVEELFYFQIDNPLVRVPDPVFLGFHRRENADVSSKVVEKSFPGEKLGAIVTAGGRPAVIEYSDFDERAMNARDPAGRLLFSHGSIAVHLLSLEFLGRPGFRLPYHLARKRVRALNPTPAGTETVEREAVKLELFIFDAIPLARRALFFETERAEEFAPLKNREGVDSLETCVRGQVEKSARWLEACGVAVPRDAVGRSRYTIEISPLFALDPSVLAAKRGSLKDSIDEDTLLV